MQIKLYTVAAIAASFATFAQASPISRRDVVSDSLSVLKLTDINSVPAVQSAFETLISTIIAALEEIDLPIVSDVTDALEGVTTGEGVGDAALGGTGLADTVLGDTVLGEAGLGDTDSVTDAVTGATNTDATNTDATNTDATNTDATNTDIGGKPIVGETAPSGENTENEASESQQEGGESQGETTDSGLTSGEPED